MKKKFFIGLFILATIGLSAFAYFTLREKSPNCSSGQQNLQAPIEIPATGIMQLDDAVKTDKPVLAMFYVDWCTYCRRFMPIFGALSALHKDEYTFAVINCDLPENKEVTEKYAVSGYPTLIIIDKKLDFDMVIHPAATMEKEVMDRELDKYLKLRKRVLK